jgi:DNA-binding PadR family transcriptional regulator
MVGLSAGEAVLGLVIEQPDSASRLGQRLVERFRSAQFTRSTAHNALNRLTHQGLVRVVADADRPIEEHCYEATPQGVEHFRTWLRASCAAAPALREELQAKVEFCTPEDLPRLIEAICAEERACANMFAAAQGHLSAAELVAPRHSTGAERWSALTRRTVLRDEAAMWGMRFKRLERLRARLEELMREASRAHDPEMHAAPGVRGATRRDRGGDRPEIGRRPLDATHQADEGERPELGRPPLDAAGTARG